jgi:16S rRNA (cytosine967-C5)-methyltransferase
MAPNQRKAANAISPARREAFAILLKLEREDTHSDDLLRSPRVSALSSQDRNLATTLVMGALRWQIALDAAIRPLLAKPNARLDPEIKIALRLGAFQLLHLERIPAHAAISESVALAKSAGHKFASGMVNAVLRRLAAPAAQAQTLLETISGAKEISAHPAWLVERWTGFYGPATTCAICQHGQQQPEQAIRLSHPALEAELAEQGIALEPGALLTAARRVISGDITATPAFRSGQVRIQDEGSQLIAELLGKSRPVHGAKILDACAAPGGKTLILAERNPQAHITANEPSLARLAALRQRFAEILNPALATQIHFQNADAASLSDNPAYDLVLADVPCSGTGTLGRNPEIRHRLQLADLARHHEQQCAILQGALRAASAPSAQVLYSTCSLEPEENSSVIAAVLSQEDKWQQVSLVTRIHGLLAEGRITESAAQSMQSCISKDGSLSLLPGSLGPNSSTDGFFAALFERIPPTT